MGDYIIPVPRNFLNLSGGTVSGDTLFSANLSAGTIFSGSTNLSDIFHNHYVTGGTFIDNQLSFLTSGGIAYSVDINSFTGLTIYNTLSATTLDGGIILSGGTNLYDIFDVIGSEDITRVQPGINIFTGGTENSPTVNITAATINNLTVSGDTLLGSVSAITYYGDGSQLSGISTDNFYTTAATLNSMSLVFDRNDIPNAYAVDLSGIVSHVQSGINIFTGGTSSSPTVNLTAATLDNLNVSGASSLGVVSATTIISGTTNLYDIFLTSAPASDITRVQLGINIFTGGTDNFPTLNFTAATIDYLIVSGNTTLNSISASTIISGSTDLYDIFALAGSDTNDITRVQPGTNIFTGGTDNYPTVNITAATLDSASITTLSADTIYSGSTNLYDIFDVKGSEDITRVQPGTNIFTGGTDNYPTVNLTAATIDNLTVSGTTSLQSLDIVSFTAASESIITTSGSTLLQQYLTTDTEFITNSTLITAIISPSNWNNGAYTGTTVEAVEGQSYVSNYYKYLFNNSVITRYLFADYPVTLYTDYTITTGATLVATTATTAVRNVIVNSITGSTITLPVANQMVFEQIYIKNIGTGTTIIDSISPSTIDGSASGSTLLHYGNLNLKIYNNQYCKF